MRLPLILVLAALAAVSFVIQVSAQGGDTPVTVGDGSVRLAPKSALDKEWDVLGAAVRRKKGGSTRIVSVQASGAGAVSTNAVNCAPGRNCSLLVVFRGPDDFAVVTISSERGGRGVTIANSIPWDDFSGSGDALVREAAYRVVWAGITAGSTITQLCRDSNTSPSCSVQVNFR
jgi:hypothetical protein